MDPKDWKTLNQAQRRFIVRVADGRIVCRHGNMYEGGASRMIRHVAPRLYELGLITPRFTVGQMGYVELTELGKQVAAEMRGPK